MRNRARPSGCPPENKNKYSADPDLDPKTDPSTGIIWNLVSLKISYQVVWILYDRAAQPTIQNLKVFDPPLQNDTIMMS